MLLPQHGNIVEPFMEISKKSELDGIITYKLRPECEEFLA
jgi:hypothetical protein